MKLEGAGGEGKVSRATIVFVSVDARLMKWQDLGIKGAAKVREIYVKSYENLRHDRVVKSRFRLGWGNAARHITGSSRQAWATSNARAEGGTVAAHLTTHS